MKVSPFREGSYQGYLYYPFGRRFVLPGPPIKSGAEEPGRISDAIDEEP
jgi:hypothetical protein